MKIFISYFFTILFAIVLVMPTVISLADHTQDVSIYLDVNEEEENNEGKESKTDIEIKLFAQIDKLQVDLKNKTKIENISFQSKNYFTTYFTIDTPPPKQTLLL